MANAMAPACCSSVQTTLLVVQRMKRPGSQAAGAHATEGTITVFGWDWQLLSCCVLP